MDSRVAAPSVPHCRSLSPIGQRPASTLYAADSQAYGGAVTVSVYPPLGDGRARREFDEAVDVGRRLGAHPSFVTVYASGEADDGRPYVVLDGHTRTTLDGMLATGGSFDVATVLHVGVTLAGALETAHRAGVVHGDVAPEVVLLQDDGHPILTDVGFHRVGQGATEANAALVWWIPYHAPPESLEGTGLGPTTDVYSLASVLYTMLMGRAPRAGDADDTPASLLLRILQMPVSPTDRPDVPPELEDALQAGLANDPRQRPQSALELARQLQAAQRSAGVGMTDPLVLDPLDQTGAPPVSAPVPWGASGLDWGGPAPEPSGNGAPSDWTTPPSTTPAREAATSGTPSDWATPPSTTPTPEAPTSGTPFEWSWPSVPIAPGDPQGRRTDGNGRSPSPAADRSAERDASTPWWVGIGDGMAKRSDSGSGSGGTQRRPAADETAPPPVGSPSWASPSTQRSEHASSALARARQARLERQRRERLTGSRAEPAATAASPDDAATARTDTVATSTKSSRVGPPAMPVVVLVVVVMILGAAAAWMVITGQNRDDPASSLSDASTTAIATNRASNLTVLETEQGVRLEWDGPVGIDYEVRVLSPDEPPVVVDAGPATTLIVPSRAVQPGTAHCFDVRSTDDAGDAARPDVLPTACLPGANPDSMQR